MLHFASEKGSLVNMMSTVADSIEDSLMMWKKTPLLKNIVFEFLNDFTGDERFHDVAYLFTE